MSILAQELGPESVAELLQSFLHDAPDQIREIRALAEVGDQATLRRTAHSLKGAAALFGVASLEAAALRMEKMAAASETAGQKAQAAEISQQFDNAIPALRRALGGLFQSAPSATRCASG